MKLSVLDQDKIWVDVSDDAIPLEELGKYYARNIIGFLYRKGEYLRNKWEWYQLSIMPMGHSTVSSEWNGTTSDTLADQLESLLMREMALPFDEWFESRPLIKRLRELS